MTHSLALQLPSAFLHLFLSSALTHSYVFKNKSCDSPLPAWVRGESTVPATYYQMVWKNKSSSCYTYSVFISLKWLQNDNKNETFS